MFWAEPVAISSNRCKGKVVTVCVIRLPFFLGGGGGGILGRTPSRLNPVSIKFVPFDFFESAANSLLTLPFKA